MKTPKICLNGHFFIILNIGRMYLKTAKILSKNNSMRVLSDTEKLEFVSKSVSWIEGRVIMDTCFVLNFGYEEPLPWPQVLSFNIKNICSL